ncbi:hypothetical protein EZS27_007901 [termite gut metagenome]|uniref:HNH nuclease domain-containing protein n=1 Tax=termite gut metagenome TaxID=433724 RepID=A0A5J4SGI0_9ZZZZ
MKELLLYTHYFSTLNRNHSHINGYAPHKPILLLSVIDCIEKGYINDSKIYISSNELVSCFKKNWGIWVKTDYWEMNFRYPFYHMSSEPFWRLVANIGHKIENIKPFNALKTINYACIDNELYLILSDNLQRQKLKQTLIKTYFSSVTPTVDDNSFYLDEESPYSYEVRAQAFQRQISLIYNSTCCITGMRIVSNYNISMIDACHIIPFAETHDDTIGNGLALCPNLHRAFDRGLITIDENYKIVVSKSFNEELDTTYSINQFENKIITLPQNKKFYPQKENLIWHNENVFIK